MLAESIRAVVTAVERLRIANDGQFLSDSPAVSDWQTNEQVGGWGDQPLQDVYRTGSLYWYLIRDQARAVATLLDGGHTIALMSAARALAEPSARGWYLLAPDLPPDERTRRLVNDRLHALFEERRFAKALPGLDTSWQRDHRDRLLRIAADMGLQVTQEGGGSHAYVGEKRPSTMQLLGQMTGRPDYASAFYRSTSGITHASLHELVKHLSLSVDASNQYRAEIEDISPGDAAAKIGVSIVAFSVSARYLVLQAGWDTEIFDVADERLGVVINEILDS